MKRFNCIAYDVPQRSEAWHELRKGKLTASAVGDWLAEEPKVRLTIAEIRSLAKVGEIATAKSDGKEALIATVEDAGLILPRSITQKGLDAREKAINGCLGDLARLAGPDSYDVDPDGPPPRNPATWAIWNGIRLEDEAREALERHQGVKIEAIGFMSHPGKAAGCSPDGLVVGQKRGVEIKCPLAQTHVGYLRKGGLPDTYRAQVQFSMAITGAEAWHFWSYCPGLPPFHVLQERDETTERMAQGVEDFTKALTQARTEMAELWENSQNDKGQASSGDNT